MQKIRLRPGAESTRTVEIDREYANVPERAVSTRKFIADAESLVAEEKC